MLPFEQNQNGGEALKSILSVVGRCRQWKRCAAPPPVPVHAVKPLSMAQLFQMCFIISVLLMGFVRTSTFVIPWDLGKSSSVLYSLLILAILWYGTQKSVLPNTYLWVSEEIIWVFFCTEDDSSCFEFYESFFLEDLLLVHLWKTSQGLLKSHFKTLCELLLWQS